MNKKYFSIERNGECWMPVILADHNGNPTFEEFLDMNYEETKTSDKLEDFIVASMDAANRKSENVDEQTIVTLIGEDGCFEWSIIMGAGDDGDIQYVLVDWRKDGNHYCYES